MDNEVLIYTRVKQATPNDVDLESQRHESDNDSKK